jgi:redox-sensitive bicupin YhaK (pirin superfamily)
VALPKDKEDIDPSFDHYDQKDIPKHETSSSLIDIVAGSAYGKTSPLKAYSPMTFLVVKGKAPGKISFSQTGHELALYIVEGSATIDGVRFERTKLVVFKQGSEIEFEHSGDAVIALLGGVPFPEERYIEWNFVSSSKEKIEAAKKAWMNGTFPLVPGDPEKIPFPGEVFYP